METWEINDAGDVSKIYERLLKPSFPRTELSDLGVIIGGWAAGALDIVCVADADGNPGAVAIGERDRDSDVVLLAWLAVAPESRGQGLGGEVLRRALERWQRRWDPLLVLAEVEHPTCEPDEPTHGDPVDRLRFYAQAGGRVLDVPYYQPRLRPWGRRVPSMMLVALDGPAIRPDGTVESAPVRLWLGRTMSHEPRDDARRRLFAALAPERLETLPLDADEELLPADGGINLHPSALDRLAKVGVGVGRGAAKAGRGAAFLAGKAAEVPLVRRGLARLHDTVEDLRHPEEEDQSGADEETVVIESPEAADVELAAEPDRPAQTVTDAEPSSDRP